jgi:hypothetical protein
VASKPGTYLYQSGTDGGRQVPMGLYGALIVRPAGLPGQAYGDAVTAFTQEGLLVMSELDPFFNADPDNLPVDKVDPVFFLFNGKPFPLTENVGANAGDTVLLRYVNAGTQVHAMGVLGASQTLVGRDGQPWPHPINVVVETLSPSQTVDALVTVPLTAETGAKLPIYHTNLMLQNNNAHDAALTHVVDFGGMLSFIEVVSGVAPGAAGPLVTAIAVNPNKTNGATEVTLAADVAGATSVEYYIDVYDGTPDGTSGSSLSVPIDTSAMESGEHTFYVRGSDGTNWGPVSSAVLTLDKTGPASTGMSLIPPATNGTVSVLLQTTGSDLGLGLSPVVAAQYGIDAAPSIMMTRNQPPDPSHIVAFKTTIDAATIGALPEGLHDVRVTSQDEVIAGENNWGAESVIALMIDKTGPSTDSVALEPSTLDFSSGPISGTVKVTAVVSDPVSNGAQTNVVAVEGFIDTVGANGTGFKVFPTDGMWDEDTEEIYFNIPLTNFFILSQGDHPVYIHGRDFAGNWGPTSSANVTVIKQQTGDVEGPAISNLTASPYPANNNRPVTVTALAVDALSNVQSGEWFVGGDPGYGNGFAMPAKDGAFDSLTETLETVISVASWPNGTYQLNVRAQDAAGNWGLTNSVSVRVVGNSPNVIMMNGFELGPTGFDGWTGTMGSATTTQAAALGGSLKGMMNPLGDTTPSVAFLTLPVGETALNANFLIKPNGVNLMGGETDIFTGFNGGTPVFGITLDTPADAAKFDYEVSAWVNNSGVIERTEGFHIKSLEESELGISWSAGVDTTFTFTIDGVAVAEINSLDTSSFTLHELWLGPATNLNTSMSGAMYFDAFYAERQTKAAPILIYLPIIN